MNFDENGYKIMDKESGDWIDMTMYLSNDPKNKGGIIYSLYVDNDKKNTKEAYVAMSTAIAMQQIKEDYDSKKGILIPGLIEGAGVTVVAPGLIPAF